MTTLPLKTCLAVLLAALSLIATETFAATSDSHRSTPVVARLITAQVQQYGPPPVVNPETGEVEFPIRSSWVLLTS